VNVRRPREADAPAIAQWITALDVHLLGRPTFTEADLRAEWRELDIARDVWLVDVEGELAGCAALLTARAPAVRGYVHPRFFGRGIGARLVELTEAEALVRGAEALRSGALAEDVRAHELLRSRGYREVRRFYRMTIELDELPEPADWPPGFRVAPLDYDAEADEFHATLDDAFADEWGHEPGTETGWRERRERRGLDPGLCFVVKNGTGAVAAAALCEEERFGVGWIAAIGVRREWRRRGLGLALLRHAFGELFRRGRRRIELGVDSDNPTGAPHLYERAGMRVAFSSVYFEKELTA
jgi:ribosomal protein S18 acetylase RimI-like enzyme